jgi:hypothetical protein
MTYGKFTTLVTIEPKDLDDLNREFTFVFDTEADGIQTVVFTAESIQGRQLTNAQLYELTETVGEQNAEIWQNAITSLRAQFG